MEAATSEDYKKGVKRGIEFAVDHFLNALPAYISDPLNNTIVDYLVSHHNEIESYKVTE